MKLGRMTLPYGALVAACLLAAACGGGDDGATTDDSRSLLQGMVLTAADLPQGLQQASVSVSTNQDIADVSVDKEGTLANLEARGRRLGYDVQFEPAVDAPASLDVQGVQVTASIYKTADGAQQALQDGLASARQTDWKLVYPDEKEILVDEPTLPPGVDEGGWFRISGLDSKGNLIIDDQMAFRVGNVRSFLRALTAYAMGTDRNSYKAEVSQWGAKLAARIGNVLANGVPSPTSSP